MCNSLTYTSMWKLGLRPRYSFSGNICFKFSAFFLYSVMSRPSPHVNGNFSCGPAAPEVLPVPHMYGNFSCGSAAPEVLPVPDGQLPLLVLSLPAGHRNFRYIFICKSISHAHSQAEFKSGGIQQVSSSKTSSGIISIYYKKVILQVF
jgi:hypothetical protein